MDQTTIDKIEPEVQVIMATASMMSRVPNGTEVPSELVVFTGQAFMEAMTNTLEALIGTDDLARLLASSMAKIEEAERLTAELADEMYGENGWEWID